MLTSNSQLRSAAPIILSGALFAACILFAYCWFNTDIGRSATRPSTLDSRPLIWLTAKTNIPGYTFIPEPVSDEVVRDRLFVKRVKAG